MIEKIFAKNSIKKPLILTNCTFFIDLEHYDIGNTYIFRNQTRYKVEEFGQLWVADYINGEIFTKGYFTSPPYSDIVLSTKIFNSDSVAIIGYSGKSRYHVLGISVGDTKMEGDFVGAFSFLDIKKLS
ncbi:hypothetical protein ACW0KB_09715 [Virgibacillus salarius]